MSSNWRVAAGEESEEAGAEHGRAFKVLESFYPRPTYIPSNPFEPPNVKQEDYDDSLTPIIPIIGVEEMDIVSETPSLEPLVDESENKTSLDENQTTGSGAETISAGDVRISAGDVELAAAAAAIFFSVLVKSTEQGNIIDPDLLVKFLFDPQTIEKFMKSKTPSPESKQASPQNPQSSPPLSQPETQQTTLSLPMSSPELPPTESKQIALPTPLLGPEVLLSESKQMCPPNLPSNSEEKSSVPVSEEKSSPAPTSSPNLSCSDSKKVQQPTSPASPRIVLPESQHIHPSTPLSSPEASQSVTKNIHPSIAVSVPKQLPTESKPETPIPLSSPELSLPQPMQTSPPNPVSSYELSFEPKRITPPVRPSQKILPPTPANAIFSAQNQMQPPFRAPQARPVVAPLPGLDGVKAQSSALPIRFAGPPLATSCTLPYRPSFTYNVGALQNPIPVPIMAAGRARPPSGLLYAPIPTPCAMPDRPTFPPRLSILPRPALVPTMWASTAHPGSALLCPRMPPSSSMPARPSFTYQVSAPPSPAPVPIKEAVRPQPVKDPNFYKNLVRQHGGEQPEDSVHIAPNAVNQNQLQNLTMDQKLGPKEEKKVCMFFNTAKGCQHGFNCSYLHAMSSQQVSDNPAGEQSAKRTKFA